MKTVLGTRTEHLKTIHLDPYQKLCAHMAEVRKAANYSQEELGKRLGKPQPYVSKIEAGQQRLDLVEFITWCKALEADPVGLFTGLAEALAASSSIRPRKRAGQATKD